MTTRGRAVERRAVRPRQLRLVTVCCKYGLMQTLRCCCSRDRSSSSSMILDNHVTTRCPRPRPNYTKTAIIDPTRFVASCDRNRRLNHVQCTGFRFRCLIRWHLDWLLFWFRLFATKTRKKSKDPPSVRPFTNGGYYRRKEHVHEPRFDR